ncbi:MAG TPA: PAS domain S-box protein, partial [Blastocatellia bacterium]
MGTKHVVVIMLLLQCGGAVLLAITLGYFHRLYGRRYLMLWSKSWLASAVHLFVSASAFFSSSLLSNKPFGFAAAFVVIASSYFQVSWLLFGAYEMAAARSAPQRLIRLALLGSVVVALVATLLIKGDWLGTEPRMLLSVGEEWLVTGSAFFLGAYGVFRGREGKKSFGRKLAGLAMIVTGLYQIAYFSLAAVDSVFKTQLFTQFHYGMLLDFPLQSAIGLGLVIWLLEEERENVLQAADALREGEQRLRLAASAANLDIWEIDVATGKQTSGQYAQVGPPFETYREFLDIIHPSDRQAVEDAARRAVREGAPFNVEFRIMHEGERWLASRGATFRDENGRAVRVIGAAQDITERKQTEEALRASEARFSKAFNASPRPMSIIRLRDRCVIDVNESVSRVTGYAREEIIGRTPQELNFWIDDKDRLSVRQALEKEGRISAFEIGFRTRQGPSRQGLFSAEMIEIDGEQCLLATVEDITERKRAEEALRESESLFRTLAETISAGLYIYRGTQYIYVNSAAEKITGYSRDELLSMPIWEPFHPDFRETIRQRTIARQRGADAPSQYEAKLLTKNGENRWVYINAKVIVYQGEQAVLATAFDITERRLAEEALRESEERYRAFVANSSEGISRIELDQPIPVDLPAREQAELFLERAYLAECNEAFARMYGYDDPHSIIGRRTGEFWAASKEEQIQWMIGWVEAGHGLTDLETREHDREGNTVYFLNNTTGIVENGRLLRVWGTQRDITERRRTEEALRISEERFSKAFNLSPHPMSIATFEDSRYISVNESTLEATGYTRDEMIGRSPGEIGLWANSADRDLIRRALNEEGRVHNLELRYRTKSGEERDALFSVEVIELDGKPCLLTTTNDITDRKRAEEAVRKSELEYRNLFESANDAIVIFEPKDEIILEANNRACQFYGYSKDELVGMSLKNFTKDVVRGEQFIYQTLRDRSRTGF